MSLTLLAALALAGCGKNSGGNSPDSAAAKVALPEPPLEFKGEPGIPGGRLVVASFGDPKTFNPITAAETSSTDILLRLFSGLVSIDVPKQEILPGLAESWSVAPDKKTWTFKLRKGLRWSDGEPLTTDDVVFTWNDIIYNTNIVNVTVDQFRIDGKDFAVSKVDDLTVQIVTPDIYAPFLQFAGAAAVLPKHKLAKAVAEKRFESSYGINSKPGDIVGCGPYRLKQYRPAQSTVLERNPYYFVVDKKGQRLPYIDSLIFSVVPDQNAISLRFLSGEADVQEWVRPEEYDRFKTEAAKGRFKLLELGLASERDYIAFNQNTGTNSKTGKPYVDAVKLKWFRNAKFRQAVSYAIDRQAIVRSTLGGHGEPNYGYSPQGSPWYNSNISKYPHNLEKARELLGEIGIKDRNGDGLLEDAEGHLIEFTLISNTGNSRREKGSVIIQEDLKRLGIRVIYQPVEFNTLVDKLDNSFDFDCYFLGWGGGPPDPAYGMNILKSDGFSHQWFPKQKTPSTEWEARIDQLVNAQLKTLDFAERKKYYDEIQAILAEQVPMIFISSMQAASAVRADIGNVRASTLDPNRVLWNVEELYFQKK